MYMSKIYSINVCVNNTFLIWSCYTCMLKNPGRYSFSSIQLLSHVWLCNPMDCSTLPCLSPIPGACSNSYPSSQWWHLTILSFVISFSSCLQSFPESGTYIMSQFFTIGGWSIAVSASASVLPMKNQDWFPLGLTLWSPCSPGDSQESFPTPQFKSISSSSLSFLDSPAPTSLHDYWKNHSLD